MCVEETVRDAAAPVRAFITFNDDQSGAAVRFMKGAEVVDSVAQVDIDVLVNPALGQRYSVAVRALDADEANDLPMAVIQWNSGNGRGAIEFIDSPWAGWWNYMRCVEQ